MKRLITCITPNINISHLIRDRFIQDGAKIKAGKYEISENWMVEISSDLTNPANRIMRVKYQPEAKIKGDIEIKIAAVPTKHGGLNLFLICPVSDLQTKQLYFCDESMGFVHRDAFTTMMRPYPTPACFPLINNERLNTYKDYLKRKRDKWIEGINEKAELFKNGTLKLVSKEEIENE